MRASRKNLYEVNIWPGFVDVLGTLLIVTIFTVLISTVTQIYFNDQLEIKRGEISSLDNQITNLANQLSLLNTEKKKIDKSFATLTIEYKDLNKQKNKLDEELSKSQYNLKIKDKELDQIINERSSLLGKIQKQNENMIKDYNCGIPVNPNSIDEFSDALIKLRDNHDLRKTMGKNSFLKEIAS